jgi:hypothetical protein
MNKQEVLEKIIFYLTKEPVEKFYTIKKNKCYINISELDTINDRAKRLSFSNEDEDFEIVLQNTISSYNNKQLTFQDLKNELGRIMYNDANLLDKKIASYKSIVDKRRIIEDHTTLVINSLEKELERANMVLNDISFQLYFSNYVLFVHKFHNGSSQILDTKSSFNNQESYTDFICRESVFENMVREHYTFVKNQLDIQLEKNKNSKLYYEEVRKLFFGVTKEELYIPFETYWNIKLNLNLLFYVPVKESKLSSFYYVVNKHRVNKELKIDPYLYNTINTITQTYIEEAVIEFKKFYYDVTGHNNYEPDFLTKLKSRGSWNVVRNIFINLCLLSGNNYVFGEYLRFITREKKFYEEARFDKQYPSYIDKDMISQKIAFGIETQKDMDKYISDYIVACNTFDRREELNEEFAIKIVAVLSMLFDNYPPNKREKEDEDDSDQN